MIALRKTLYEGQDEIPDGGEEVDQEQSDPISEKDLQKEIESVTGELEAVQNGSPLVRIEVDPDVVSKVVSDWTGIPLGKVMRDEARNVLNLEENLKERIKGLADPTLCACIRLTLGGCFTLQRPAIFMFEK